MKKEEKSNGLHDFLRKDAVQSVIASLICIAGGLFVGFLVMLLLSAFSSDVSPAESLKGLKILLGGPFSSGSSKNILFIFGDMILESTPLIMTGLSVAVAFKTGLFNIGAPGQYLVGAAASLIVALSIPTTEATAFWVWLLAFFVGMLAGMVWGAIPGIFKAYLGVNEVIVCIMTNWIAANLVSWIFDASGNLYKNIAETKVNFVRKTITNGVMTPRLGLDKLFPGSHIDISIFIAILFAILIWIMLNKTTFGYELKACGFNKDASKYAGMNEKRNIVLSMVIAGGLAAAGAALWYLNGYNDFNWSTYSSLPDNGFNGIPAALLANSNPIGVIFSSIFLRYIEKGGFNLQFTAYNEYVSQLVIAMIIYFAGFTRFIREVILNRKKKINSAKEIKSDDEGKEKE